MLNFLVACRDELRQRRLRIAASVSPESSMEISCHRKSWLFLVLGARSAGWGGGEGGVVLKTKMSGDSSKDHCLRKGVYH